MTEPGTEPRTRLTTQPEMGLAEVLDQLQAGAREALGDGFVGACQVGSFALGAGDEASDVDFLVVVRDGLSAEQEAALRVLHAHLTELPSPWAQHLEGSYAPARELRSPPEEGQPVPPWLYVDNGATSMQWSTHDNNLVTRWITREHGIVLAGPPPRELIDPVTPAQLSAEARSTLTTWDGALRERQQWFEDLLSQQQHVLGLCRVLHCVQHGQVLSKVAAARWFCTEAGDGEEGRWGSLVWAAVEGRRQGWQRLYQGVPEALLQETVAFHEHVLLLAGS